MCDAWSLVVAVCREYLHSCLAQKAASCCVSLVASVSISRAIWPHYNKAGLGLLIQEMVLIFLIEKIYSQPQILIDLLVARLLFILTVAIHFLFSSVYTVCGKLCVHPAQPDIPAGGRSSCLVQQDHVFGQTSNQFKQPGRHRRHRLLQSSGQIASTEGETTTPPQAGFSPVQSFSFVRV